MWYFALCVTLCTMRGTLLHVGLRDVAPTQLQEVAPYAKSHKVENSFAKFTSLFIENLKHFHAYANELSHTQMPL